MGGGKGTLTACTEDPGARAAKPPVVWGKAIDREDLKQHGPGLRRAAGVLTCVPACMAWCVGKGQPKGPGSRNATGVSNHIHNVGKGTARQGSQSNGTVPCGKDVIIHNSSPYHGLKRRQLRVPENHIQIENLAGQK